MQALRNYKCELLCSHPIKCSSFFFTLDWNRTHKTSSVLDSTNPFIRFQMSQNPAMKNWVSGFHNLSSRCKECVVSNWVHFDELMLCFETGILVSAMKRTVMSLLTCILALGGASVGTITGAIKGQTTETGLFRGAGVGAVTGAITALQLMELMVNGEPFSKVALICSLVNGKIFMEWVSPAVLKAYQWQIGNMDTNLREISDIFEINGTKGLSDEAIKALPNYKFRPNGRETNQETTCAICLMDFVNGERTRRMPVCRHSFHVNCIDEWLFRHGSCPVCRRDLQI